MIDIHSHILPGVDDGVKTLASSIELIRELSRSGATDIIATPHYVSETRYVSRKDNNLHLLEEVKSALLAEQINVEIYLGNEIYIDPKIAKMIGQGIVSTMAGSRYILVELPLNKSYPSYKDILVDLLDMGYEVILAHPERYEIVQTSYNVLLELHSLGVLFQCNLGSVMGKYGIEAKTVVKRIMKDSLVFAFGSDAHHCHGVDYWVKAQKKVAKYCSERQFNQAMTLNPRKMLLR